MNTNGKHVSMSYEHERQACEHELWTCELNFMIKR
jgi:hypothetical protein